MGSSKKIKPKKRIYAKENKKGVGCRKKKDPCIPEKKGCGDSESISGNKGWRTRSPPLKTF